MKKLLIITLALIAGAWSASAGKPQLKFKDGEFKILQLTDTHLRYEDPQEFAKTFARIEKIVDAEKPDFIAMTGDIVTGNRETRKEMWDTFIPFIEKLKLPFCIVFGNHDAEGDMTRPEMSERIAGSKYCLNTLNEAGELADIRISVRASKGKSPLDLYFMDSHDYPEKCGFGKGYGSYAWFNIDQVMWLRNECLAATKANDGKHVPSLAFFHIPLVEYEDAWNAGKRTGIKSEAVCSGKVNTGMFAAMVETGNMMGVFAGHDHDNNYVANLFGITLGYGAFSGDETTYNDLPHGLRIINVKEGEKTFDTWVHEEDGRIKFKAHYSNGELTKVK